MSDHAVDAPTSANERGSAEGGLLVSAWRGWERFWFSPTDPTTLCLIRLLAGVLTFYVHLTYSWGLLSYVGPQGWLNESMATYLRLEQKVYVPAPGWSDQLWETVPYDKGSFYWSVFYHVQDPAWIIGLHACFLVVMALFAAGLWTRWTGLITWVAAMSYVNRAQLTWYGVDTMMLITLTYLMVGPSGAVLSLDRWWQRRRDRLRGVPTPPPAPSVAANFAIRLIQVHFCVIYLASGTSKLLGSTWWSATAPNLVLLNYYFAPLRFAPYAALMSFLASHRWLWEVTASIGVVYTIAVEVGLPLLIWDPRWRWVMICASVLLHTMIGVFMGLVTFSLMMLVMVLSFVPPEVVRQALGRLQERLRRTLARGGGGAPAGAHPSALVLTRS
jgi:hypothetical protein